MTHASRRSLRWSDLVQGIDYEALYQDLNWVPLSSTGPEDKGYCLDPWKIHKNGDRTGKLAINRDKGVYNCWVCGGGTIHSLIMEVKSLDHDEALTYLTRFVNAHYKESSSEFYARVSRLLSDGEDTDRPFPIFNFRVIDKWESPSTVWLSARHISSEVAEFFKIRQDDKHTKYNPVHGSWEGPAIILPHFWQEQLVGWQERWRSATPNWIGKYTNTTDFPREFTLWGLDFAKSQKLQPILVESVLTALFLISEGFPAIATFGSQITPAQIKHLRSFQQGILLAPDNDPAGTIWLNKAIQGLERFVPLLEVPVVEGIGKDLGDLSPSELSLHLRDVKVAQTSP